MATKTQENTVAAPRFADLKLRMATAAIVSLVGAVLLWLGGVWTMILAAVGSGVLAWEFRTITLAGDEKGDRTDVPILIGAVVGGVIVSYFYGYAVGLRWLLWSLIVAGVADLVVGRRRAMGWGLMGGAYIDLAGIGLLYLRGLEPLGFATAIWVVAVVAAADIGGYFAGRTIGGPKLWPRISPKKTWAGAFGGVAFALLVGAVAGLVVDGARVGVVCVISALVAVISQAGDLAESTLKRHFGVKDSGNLMPGHGGALDRFDGLVAALLAVALAAWLGGRSVLGW